MSKPVSGKPWEFFIWMHTTKLIEVLLVHHLWWLISCASLGRPQFPDIWSYIILDTSMRVLGFFVYPFWLVSWLFGAFWFGLVWSLETGTHHITLTGFEAAIHSFPNAEITNIYYHTELKKNILVSESNIKIGRLWIKLITIYSVNKAPANQLKVPIG